MLRSYFSHTIEFLKAFNAKEVVVLLILSLAPTFGSLVTVFACLLGVLFLGKLAKTNFSDLPKILKGLSTIYAVYVLYFLINGFFLGGISSTIISMAPNLPNTIHISMYAHPTDS